MTPLPGALGGRELLVWRLETTSHFPTWQTAEGAFRAGGRWSPAGFRVLYTSLDPSTAIVEVGVHKGLSTLDIVPHTLLAIEILDAAKVHIADVSSLNLNWLRPGAVSAGQQAFGGGLLEAHPMVLIPSVVSTHSWNLLIDIAAGARLFRLRKDEPFALDPRLNPPSHEA